MGLDRIGLGSLSALVLALVGALAACTPEVERVEATATVVRIEADPALQAALQRLRVRTAGPQGAAWVLRNDKSFAADALRWPVDIVLTPRSEAEAGRSFEVIAEALGPDEAVLVQARALSGFVRREQRVLLLTLSACGGQPLGFVCEPDLQCLGPSCMTCVEASCAETPFSEPGSLPRFEAPADDLDAGSPDSALPDAGVDGAASDAAAEPPLQCDPGSELDGAGATCLDVDECARGLDDCDSEPEACVNQGNGLGFSCTCPAGYRGTGHGADGCDDIDECSEQIDTCAMLAECRNTPGSYACGDCMSGFGPGSGGTCEDINECESNNGGCDTSPMATCNNQTGAANTCSCPSGYSGDGKGESGCADVNECMSNNGGCDTSPMATCNDQPGAANTCSCPSSAYSGDGKGVNGCVDVNECASNNGGCDTSPMATCNDQPGAANTCSCPLGYSGDGKGASGCVDVNDCSTNPCQHDGDCVDGVNMIMCTCKGNFTGNRCELENCADTTIRSRADLDAAAPCKEIRGNLSLLGGAEEITASDLPNLTKITGNLMITTFGAQSPFIESVTLGALQVVEGSVQIIGNSKIRVVSLPALTTIGKAGATPTFQVTQASLGRLDLPALQTIYGHVSFALVSSLCSLNMRQLTSVSGDVTLSDLPNLAYSAIKRMPENAGGTVSVKDVGCCLVLDKSMCVTTEPVLWTCDAIMCP